MFLDRWWILERPLKHLLGFILMSLGCMFGFILCNITAAFFFFWFWLFWFFLKLHCWKHWFVGLWLEVASTWICFLWFEDTSHGYASPYAHCFCWFVGFIWVHCLILVLCFCSWWLNHVDKLPSWMVKRCCASAQEWLSVVPFKALLMFASGIWWLSVVLLLLSPSG